MQLAALALDDGWLDLLAEVASSSGLALAPGRLAAEVRAVSEAYNTGDFTRARGKGALAARLLFFFPRDVPKMGAAVRELVAHRALTMAADRPLRVLDVGAGLGASTWGLARALAASGARGRLEATFVDLDESALDLALSVARVRPNEGEVEVTVARGGREGEHDVVLVGQSLGEMTEDAEAQAERLEALLSRRLAPHGSLIVVEPALRERTRRLHAVRDRLIARGYTVFAPCLHAAVCPALADPGAWCHEDVRVDLPASVAAIARAAGLRWQGLTFSYLVLRKDGVTLRASLALLGLERVVSEPIMTKGKRELYLCGEEGRRRKVMRLDRDGRKHDVWSDAGRGDVLSLDPPLASAQRVPADTRMRRF